MKYKKSNLGLRKLSAYSEEQLMHDFKMDTGINIDIDRQLNFKVNEKDEHELEL